MDFRTTEPDGVIFYFADDKHVDHISVVLKDGKIRFTFNSGTGPGMLMTENTVNDGQWHQVGSSWFSLQVTVAYRLWMLLKFHT